MFAANVFNAHIFFAQHIHRTLLITQILARCSYIPNLYNQKARGLFFLSLAWGLYVDGSEIKCFEEREPVAVLVGAGIINTCYMCMDMTALWGEAWLSTKIRHVDVPINSVILIPIPLSPPLSSPKRGKNPYSAISLFRSPLQIDLSSRDAPGP